MYLFTVQHGRPVDDSGGQEHRQGQKDRHCPAGVPPQGPPQAHPEDGAWRTFRYIHVALYLATFAYFVNCRNPTPHNYCT